VFSRNLHFFFLPASDEREIVDRAPAPIYHRRREGKQMTKETTTRGKLSILIADKLSESVVNSLRELGADVRIQPELSAEELPGAVGETEILVVRSTRVTAAAIASGSSLSLIIRAGAGVNTIDIGEASRRGIHVANCPGKNTDAVAELAIGLMIAADRRIADATGDLRAGSWKKKEYGAARGLRGRTLGVIGFGAIGTAVAGRARGMHMKVAAWSRSLTPERAEELEVTHCGSPLEVARKADVVSVHLAATDDTRHLIGANFFAAMKPGAVFVNTSRGEIVDSAALLAAVTERGIRAALDVYETEPSGGEAPFEQTELAGRITCTPHIGASTDQASEAIAAEVVHIVRVYLETGKPPRSVNTREKSSAQSNLVVRHYNKVGVLASVLDEIKIAGINIEEMENTIFADGTAASCTLKLDERPETSVVEKLRGLEENSRLPW